jgi:prepilin-type N-terminal cleavage/methylation domain-containing protein
LTRFLKEETGYSLVEVMVAIMILAIAIIPMVGMFDAGLRAAVSGSNYDRARTLANEKLEEVRALPYKRPGTPADSVIERYDPASSEVTGAEGIFTYTIQTRFVDANFANPSTSPPTPQMRAQVTVQWQENTYTTTGYVAGG